LAFLAVVVRSEGDPKFVPVDTDLEKLTPIVALVSFDLPTYCVYRDGREAAAFSFIWPEQYSWFA
jgi:uncharacterized protein YcsI (UPF0317 family)